MDDNRLVLVATEFRGRFVTRTIGAAFFNDGTSDHNVMQFIARMVLNGAATATLVEVVSVSGNFVTVHPLVNQVDGLGNATPHGQVNNLPFLRLQGGTSAIEMPPAVGDIGLAVFCDHDVSSVVRTGGAANPGSARRFSFSDGVYVTGIAGLCPVPTQFIQMLTNAGGINITTPGVLTISASSTNITGGLMSNGKNVSDTHEHSGVSTGASNTGPVV